MTVDIYTDASPRRHRSGPLLGMAAVMILDGKPREFTKVVRCFKFSSSLAEVLAVEMALSHLKRDLRPRITVRIYSDNRSCCDILNGAATGRKHRAAFDRLRAALSHFAAWSIEWVPGHSGQVHNERADRLAWGALEQYSADLKVKQAVARG